MEISNTRISGDRRHSTDERFQSVLLIASAKMRSTLRSPSIVMIVLISCASTATASFTSTISPSPYRHKAYSRQQCSRALAPPQAVAMGPIATAAMLSLCALQGGIRYRSRREARSATLEALREECSVEEATHSSVLACSTLAQVTDYSLMDKILDAKFDRSNFRPTRSLYEASTFDLLH